MTNSIPYNPSLRRGAYALDLHRACSTRTGVQLCVGIGRELGNTVAVRSCTGVTRGATRKLHGRWCRTESTPERLSSVPQLIDTRLGRSRASSIASPHDALKRVAFPKYASSSVAYCAISTLLSPLGSTWDHPAAVCTSGLLAKPRPLAIFLARPAHQGGWVWGWVETTARPHTSTCPIPTRRRTGNPIGGEALAVGRAGKHARIGSASQPACFADVVVPWASAWQIAPADSPAALRGPCHG
jgi:hypothetical protein